MIERTGCGFVSLIAVMAVLLSQPSVCRAAEGGVIHTDAGDLTLYDTANSSLPGNFVHAIAMDSTGRIWAGCFRDGLAVFESGKWTSYHAGSSGLVSDSVRVLAVDQRNRLWIGTSNGLGRYDGISWDAFRPQNSPMAVPHVWSLAVDHDTSVWFGCSNVDTGGLINLKDDRWTLYTPGNSVLPCRVVNTILVTRSGVKWIGTSQYQGQGGLVKIDTGGWTLYDKSNSVMRYNSVEALAETPDGSIWVGQGGWFYPTDSLDGALFRVRPDAGEWGLVKPSESGLSSNCVWSLGVDQRGRVWVSTGPDNGNSNATSIYDGEKWVVLIGVHAWAMVADRADNMWLACGEGVLTVPLRGIDSLFSVSVRRLTPTTIRTATVLPEQLFNLLGRKVSMSASSTAAAVNIAKGVYVVRMPSRRARGPVRIVGVPE
jgi:ligand-binding sensor domain-containing protein